MKQQFMIKEKKHLLREDLLLEKISRIKVSEYKSLNIVNEMTDYLYTANNEKEEKDRIINVSDLQNNLLSERLKTLRNSEGKS
jgi:hypothetical protein